MFSFCLFFFFLLVGKTVRCPEQDYYTGKVSESSEFKKDSLEFMPFLPLSIFEF